MTMSLNFPWFQTGSKRKKEKTNRSDWERGSGTAYHLHLCQGHKHPLSHHYPRRFVHGSEYLDSYHNHSRSRHDLCLSDFY